MLQAGRYSKIKTNSGHLSDVREPSRDRSRRLTLAKFFRVSHLRIALVIAVLLGCMACAIVVGRRQRLGTVLLALLSVLWLLVNKDFEGPILLTVVRDHGLTTADLVGLAGLILAAWQFWRLR